MEESTTLESSLVDVHNSTIKINEENTFDELVYLSDDSSDCCTTSGDDSPIVSDAEASSVPIQCLYPDSSISMHDLGVAMLSIAYTHSLTNLCLTDILNLCTEVLLTGMQAPSRHILMKSFVDH